MFASVWFMRGGLIWPLFFEISVDKMNEIDYVIGICQ